MVWIRSTAFSCKSVTDVASFALAAVVVACTPQPNLRQGNGAGATPKGATTTTGDILTLDVVDGPTPYATLVPELTRLANAKVRGGLLFPGIDVSYAACGEVKELPETIVCIFNYKKYMNLSINRASQWVEAGEMFDHQEHFTSRQNGQIEGHDLTATSLNAFRKAFATKSVSMTYPTGFAGDEVKDAVKLEADFDRALVEPMLAKHKNLVVLSVSVDTDMEKTLDHEILHAQYFHTPAMRLAAEAYFAANVTQAEIGSIVSAFAGTYDVKPLPSDDAATKAKKRDLLVNEFQAYMLMEGAGASLLGNLVPKHRPGLLAALESAGITPFGQAPASSLGAISSPQPTSAPTPIPGFPVMSTGLECTSGNSVLLLEGFDAKVASQDIAYAQTAGSAPAFRNLAHVEAQSAKNFRVTFASLPNAFFDIWDFDGVKASGRYWISPGFKLNDYDCVAR